VQAVHAQQRLDLRDRRGRIAARRAGGRGGIGESGRGTGRAGDREIAERELQRPRLEADVTDGHAAPEQIAQAALQLPLQDGRHRHPRQHPQQQQTDAKPGETPQPQRPATFTVRPLLFLFGGRRRIQRFHGAQCWHKFRARRPGCRDRSCTRLSSVLHRRRARIMHSITRR